MYRLLQLSDIHYGKNHAFAQNGRPPTARSFDEAIRRGLAEARIDIGFDALIVSGDVFDRREANERTEARLQLQQLAADLEAERTIAVPGNHDVDWDADPTDKMHDYDALVRAIGATGTSDDLPTVTVMERDALKPLALLGLDSCQIESKRQSGLGCVGARQLDTLARRMTELGITPQTHTIIAVLHHHLLPVATVPVLPLTANPEDAERLMVSVTVDASTVLHRLSELGTSLVLHGHQHVTAVMQHRLLRDEAKPLYVAAAGSAGIRKPDQRRQFYVWTIGDDYVHGESLRHRDDDPSRFERDQQNSADISLS